MIFVTYSEKEFNQKIWQAIKPSLSSGVVIGFIGELGAGKTSVIKYIARKLGFSGEVSSPTFVIRQTYPIKERDAVKYIEHIDIYRIGDVTFQNFAEIKEWVGNKGTITLIEWVDLLPDKKILDIIVNIRLISKDVREVEINWS